MKKLLCIAALGILCAANSGAPASSRYALPAVIEYPEGIVYDPAHHSVYVAGTRSGTITWIDTRTGKSRIVGDGPKSEIGDAFPGVLGLELYRGRLWMAGGLTGKIFVAETRHGRRIATIATQSARPGLINDVAMTNGMAYFTDTLFPMIWAVDVRSRKPAATAIPWLDLTGSPIAYANGPNLNGIAYAPIAGALVVGQMNKGLLYRIDVATRAVTPIDVGGETFEGVDGIEVLGRTMFVIRQTAGEIVTVRMASDFRSGRVVNRVKDPELLAPATGAITEDSLVVVNTQFNRFGGKDVERPFTLQRFKLGGLMGPPEQ
jgi:Cu-Zn family superoxide dismutase